MLNFLVSTNYQQYKQQRKSIAKLIINKQEVSLGRNVAENLAVEIAW